MAWYQCSCGFLKEVTPQFGDTVASVIHLHRAARLDGTAALVRMEEVPQLCTGREAINAGADERYVA